MDFQLVDEFYLIKDKDNGFFFYFETKTSKKFVEMMFNYVFEIEDGFLTVHYVSKLFNVEEKLYFQIKNSLYLSMLKNATSINLTEIDNSEPFVYTAISSKLFEEEYLS